MNSAKGVFGLIAAVVGVVASVVGILVGVQQLRGGDNPPATTSGTSPGPTGEPADATSAEAPPASAWTLENDGGQLVLTTVENEAGECQYLHVDFDAGVEGGVQPTATSGLHVEATDDLIWNPCENGGGIYVASLTSEGTAVGAALDAASPSPEECMDAVNAAGGSNAALNLQLSFADEGLTGLSAGTSLCVWNTETSRLTVASSESMEEVDSRDEVITYWVTTYMPA